MGAPAQTQPAPAAVPAASAPASSTPSSEHAGFADAPSLNNWDSFPVNGLPAEAQTTNTEGAVPDATGDTRPLETTSPEPATSPVAEPQKAEDLETFIQREAAEQGLDETNPNHRKILKRLYDSQAHIRTLESERKPAQAATPPEPEPWTQLTEFEKQALGIDQPQTTPPATEPGPRAQSGQQAAAPAPTQAGKYVPPDRLGDVGDTWREPADAYRASNEAWQQALTEGGNFNRVIEIDNSMFTRRLHANQDTIDQMVRATVSGFLREEFPELLTTSHRVRVDQDREFAVRELEKSGLKDITTMFQSEAGAQPVTFNGVTFDASPFSRIVAQNPWILDIRKPHSDPRKADRLSTIAKIRVAYALYKRGAAKPAAPAPAQVQQIMANGAQMERRTQQDRARQAINAGGTGPVNNPTNGQQESYVRTLQRLPDEQRSIDDIFG